MDADPNSPNRLVELTGTSDAIAAAEKLINEVLAEVSSLFIQIYAPRYINRLEGLVFE
jgi:hypothetical protein